MPDNLTKTRPQDATKINMHQSYEVNWWCSELGCTAAELQNAVNKAGVSAAAVRQHLGKR